MRQVGRRVIPILGPVQNAWDIGTGLGGLGRGVIGIDEVNPYSEIPGFGAAELAWEFGNAIVEGIEERLNPNEEIEDIGQESTDASVKTNPLDFTIEDWLEEFDIELPSPDEIEDYKTQNYEDFISFLYLELPMPPKK